MTSTGRFAHLLTPGRIGSLAVRNRILMAPMGDCLPDEDGTVSDTQLAYFEARARGGAGMLLVGSLSVAYPDGSFHARQIGVSDDRFVPGLRALTERAHRHGAAIAAQLTHNGQMALHDVERGVPMVVPSVPPPLRPDALSMMMSGEEIGSAMSAYASPGARADYRAATEDDIAIVIEQFADAADRCRRSGFDGVELHAGHGYLLDEFLTPALNVRDDRWGGDVEGRARLLCETIRAIRDRVGDQYPVWARINAFEAHKDGGEIFDEQVRVMTMAVAAGLDAVHVTAYASLDAATGPTDSYVPHRVGELAALAARVREVVDVPVITFGRFEPDEAESVLAGGSADFVAMGRKLLADPDLPNKLAEDRVDDVRPCLYQYRCIGNIFLRSRIGCVVNPEVGHEDRFAAGAAASLTGRQVLVVGGGPAGMETAWRLAERGAAVTIWDSGDRLGGALALAARADEVLDRYLGWLRRQVERAGVTIELGRTADVASIQGAGAHEVVVATGLDWVPLSIPGGDAPHVHTIPALRDWLDHDDEQIGAEVLVAGGGKPALSLADLCARRGRTVTVVEPTPVFGPELGLPGRFRLVRDLEDAGVALLGSTAVLGIEEDAVLLRMADGSEQRRPVDSVIVASGARPADALLGELAAAGVGVHAAGDCAGVRRIEGATSDAAELARTLSP
jgi:2,4-dienoyl-CoA reductase (NADPH2)